MRAIPALTVLLLTVVACAGNATLQGAFERWMEANNAAAGDFTIIHIDEGANDGIVLFAQAGEAALFYFSRTDRGWEHQTGTECSQAGVSRIGLMGSGYAHCATLRADMPFERIRVGGREAMLFQTADPGRVWYTRAEELELDVTGITADGAEHRIN